MDRKINMLGMDGHVDSWRKEHGVTVENLQFVLEYSSAMQLLTEQLAEEDLEEEELVDEEEEEEDPQDTKQERDAEHGSRAEGDCPLVKAKLQVEAGHNAAMCLFLTTSNRDKKQVMNCTMQVMAKMQSIMKKFLACV